MAVSKRLRYEVLRRDNYTCRYCGAKAPDVEVTVDHVVPVALGGTDEPTNLVAACRDCNGGKTSSSPDAPIVAQVADDALRWAQAMQQAQGQMLADLDAREVSRQQFDKHWDAWRYEQGGKRRRFPRPVGWEQSVDGILAAGLPLRALVDCVDVAMTRTKVTNDDKFRYTCGAAWGKLTDLQKSAQATIDTPGAHDEDELSPDEMSGRAGFACEILSDLTPEDLDRILAEAKELYESDTKDKVDIDAAYMAWQEVRTDLAWLLFSVCDLLPMIPDPVIQYAVREARNRLYDEHGPGFSKDAWANSAMSIAAARYTGADALDKDGAPF